MKKPIWLVASSLMALSLAIAACAPAAITPTTTPATSNTPSAPTASATSTPSSPINPATAPTPTAVTPSGKVPEYGGTLSLVLTGDLTNFDLLNSSYRPQVTFQQTNDPIWAGNWEKGPAGGYGTNDTDWGMSEDIISNKAGYVTENWKWIVDTKTNKATIVYQVRHGVHFALNPNSEASRLVNGREMTADDVVYVLNLLVTDKRTYMYGASPELRTAIITKTGPWEVSVETTVDALMTGLSRFGYWGRPIPPEVMAKYGDMGKWQNSVGTGPWILTEYIPGSAVKMIKNTNYYLQDPVGPGKGNKLPYIDTFRYLIIPDASTRQAALRTGKLDWMRAIAWEDLKQFNKTTPQLVQFAEPLYGSAEIHMRVDQPPFNNIKVRQAMMMATDFEAIRQGLNNGLGEINTWPWPDSKAYHDAFLPLEDPRMPQSVRDLYVYNPTKAKALLSEAGYPTGFKTTALMTSGEVDYYSVLKDMWSKVGVDLQFDIKETGAKNAVMTSKTHAAIASTGVGQAVMYFTGPNFSGTGISNLSMVDDPKVNDLLSKIRTTMITDEKASMLLWQDFMPYFLSQVYALPRPVAPVYDLWWPWLKNYTSEVQIGYGLGSYEMWTRWAWIDQALKKSMGY